MLIKIANVFTILCAIKYLELRRPTTHDFTFYLVIIHYNRFVEWKTFKNLTVAPPNALIYDILAK